MTTIPRFLSRAVLPLLFAALAAGSADIATAQSDPLEGKTFEGVFLQRGKTRGEKLDATAVMMQSGKTPVEHWVVAGLKK